MWEALAYWRNREKARAGGVLNDEGRMVCEEATGGQGGRASSHGKDLDVYPQEQQGLNFRFVSLPAHNNCPVMVCLPHQRGGSSLAQFLFIHCQRLHSTLQALQGKGSVNDG